MVKTKIKSYKQKRNKTKINYALILGISILALVAIAIAIIKTPSNISCTGIPVYIYNTINGCIDPVETSAIVEKLKNYINFTANNVIIAMFGRSDCIHCKNMNKFFIDNYREFYRDLWIDKDRNIEIIFSELIEIEIKSGIKEIGVPHTLIIENNSIRVIVIGEINNKDFWNNLIK